MRIALVSQEFPPETGSGGIGTQAFAKAHGLADRGHEVYVISHSVDEFRHESRQGTVHMIRIPGYDNEFPIATEQVRWLTYSMRVAAELSQLHTKINLDLVEFPEWGCEAYIHLLNRTAANRIPTLIHLHGPIVMFAHAIGWPDPNSEFYRVARTMEETCLRLADAVYSSSRCSAQWCERHYNLSAATMPVIHMGVDTSAFRPMPVSKHDRPTVVFVGRLETNKGVDVLVDAGCRLAKTFPDLKIQLLGRGNQKVVRELFEKATAAGHPNMIELPGYISRERLPEFLSRAHVFAAPSDYEGGPGFVYLEAMACGLPVVACDGSGSAAVIENGVTGFLVPPRDVDALRDVLARLLADEIMRTEIGRRARNYAVREANANDCLNLLEAFYCEVAQKCRRSPAYA
jgi:glycosyltransferase involved in cell wall biosynthesis